ncbi:MAG: hypothetical protein ACLFWL_06415 [Candidatus Brocadiia bacterium]
MSGAIDYIQNLISQGDWATLIPLLCEAIAFIIIIIFLFLLSRSRATAAEARTEVKNVSEKLHDLEAQISDFRSDLRDDLENLLNRKMDTKLDGMEERTQGLHSRQTEMLEDRSSELSGRIAKTDAEIEQLRNEFDSLRNHVQKVEREMPGVFDRLDEFKNAIARGYKSELSSVFESFDNSISAMLDQMRAELETGLSRINGIESMVRKRKNAEDVFAGEDEVPGKSSDIPSEEDQIEKDFLSKADEEETTEEAGEDKETPGEKDDETPQETKVAKTNVEAEEETELPPVDEEETTEKDGLTNL